MSWATIWQVIKSIPGIISIIKQIESWLARTRKEAKEKENSQIREDLENAKTDEESKEALSNAADRFGRK